MRDQLGLETGRHAVMVCVNVGIWNEAVSY